MPLYCGKTASGAVERLHRLHTSLWEPRITAAFTAVAIFVTMLHVPAIKGHYNNYRTRCENERLLEEARQSGLLIYKDYETFYCESDLFRGSVFNDAFFSSQNLDDINIQYTYSLSKPLPGSELPSINYNGDIYFPLRTVLESCGGSIQWFSGDFMSIMLSGKSYIYCAAYIYFNDVNKNKIRLINELFTYENITYVSSTALSTIFGIQISEKTFYGL